MDIKSLIRKKLDEAKDDLKLARAKELGLTQTSNKSIWKNIMLTKFKWNGSDFVPTWVKSESDLKLYRDNLAKYKSKQDKEAKKKSEFQRLDLKDFNGKVSDPKGFTYQWDDSKEEWSLVPEVVIRTYNSSAEVLYFARCNYCKQESEKKSFKYWPIEEQEKYYPVLKSQVKHTSDCPLR